MNNILHDSNLKITSLVETFMKNSLKNSNNEFALSDFTDNLMDSLMELGRNIVKEVINITEQSIFESSSRKKYYASVDKKDRKLLTIFGEIIFKRRQYYELKDNTNLIFLTDKCLDILEDERMLKNVEEKLITFATDVSYEKASTKASYGEKISKQTVKNKINNLKFNTVTYKEPVIKRICSNLYIQADEDHVSLQEGGIAMPRIVTIHEGVENGRLITPYTICGLYENNIEGLWEEVLEYITSMYKYEKINKIHILGDGASWIKKGTEYLSKSVYVSDRFHIFKAINTIAGNNANLRSLLRESIFKIDFDEFETNCKTIIEKETNNSKKDRLNKLLEYVLNNKNGIKKFILWDIPGCSAEGHVSHVLSARLSSRPLSWTKENVDNMAKLRAMQTNKEDIRIVTRNKNCMSKEQREELEKNIKIKKKVKKNINYNSTTFSVPAMTFGDRELRMKLKDIISYAV